MKPSEFRTYRGLGWTAAVSTFALIVLGGIVRITGSGMGCGEHWPRCNGEWFPPLDLPTMIEIGHRWAAALVSLFVLALAVVAWRRHRGDLRLRNPATLALILLVIQVLLGAVTVKLNLPPEVVIVHLGNAMVLLAVLLVAAQRSSDPEAAAVGPTRPPLHRAILGAAAFGFIVVILGALVANYHAGFLCQGFPLCSGSLMPPPTPHGVVHWVHRIAAFAFLGYVLWLVVRIRREASVLFRSALVVLGLVIAQVGVAAAMVMSLLPQGLRALHLLMGTAIWASLVILSRLSRTRRTEPAITEDASRGKEETVRNILPDLVTLTKPLK